MSKMRYLFIVFLLSFSFPLVVKAEPPNPFLDEKLLKILEMHPEIVKRIVPPPENTQVPDDKELTDLKIKIGRGDPGANITLGTLCFYGVVEGKNCSSALMMYRRVSGKNPQFQRILGELFEFGSTQAAKEMEFQFVTEAYYWYSLAVASGDAKAQELYDKIALRITSEQRTALDKRIKKLKDNPPQHATTIFLGR